MASPLRVFLLLCVFRVLNTFLIQSFFDPDEYWQTLEPAYCRVFRGDEGFACPGFTWEWKRRTLESTHFWEQSLLGPVRTYFSVLPTHFLYTALKLMSLDSPWWISRGPMILYAITVAAPTDWAVWFCARILYQTEKSSLSFWCLLSSLTAWFNAYSMVRTYTNAQEAFILMMSIVLVSPELLKGPSVKSQVQQNAYWRAKAAFFLGGLNLAIRGTSIAAYIPMGILLAWQQQLWSEKIIYLFAVCAVPGVLGVGVTFLVDCWFFGFPTFPFLGNFYFNVILNNSTLYGEHPWYWYLIAGIPAVSGLLLPFLLADIISFGQWSTGRRNLWLIVSTYILAMSTNAHKEFRFMLPLLPVFCLLAGRELQCHLGNTNHVARRFLGLTTLVIGNLIAVLYLGLFHQSGPIRVNREILRIARHNFDQISSPELLHHGLHKIDYWTGGCHSTPLLSSLHSPPLRFETRSLDCSPSCRASPDVSCETELFHRDPLSFLQGTYAQPLCTVKDIDEICTDDVESPSFVVTMSNYAGDIQNYLSELGLHEVGRYPQSISGARIGNIVFGDDYNNLQHRHMQLFDYVEIAVEDVVLFVHESILHREAKIVQP